MSQTDAVPEQRVLPLELFFDLVFVFAFTQVTTYIAADPTWTRMLDGMAILVVTWWAWGCYAWLGNSAASDDALFRITLLGAMGAMVIAALAVPHAFGRDALAFGIAYGIVRLLHMVAYGLLARRDPRFREVVASLARSMVTVAVIMMLTGVVHGEARTALWIAAIVIDVVGLWLFGVSGWQVEAHHLAERHGLIIIIALGESIVSVGVGAEETRLDGPEIAAALLGVAIAAALWWAYFDIVALVAERRFGRARGDDAVRIARDSYTYLHLPMVAGIILAALGLKAALPHVHEPLATVPAASLCGGLALYFLAHVAFRWRNVHRFNVARTVVAALLLALIPAATQADALLSLALVTAVCVGAMAYEHVRYHELRARLRRTFV